MAAPSVDYQSRPGGYLEKLRDRDAWLAVLLIAVLPNALFIFASPWLIVRRLPSPAIYLAAAVLSLALPRPFSYLLFLLAAAIDGFVIICLMFDMPFDVSLASLRFLTEIDIGASFLYVAGTVWFIVLALASAYLINRYRDRLRAASLIPLIIAVAAVIWIDRSVNLYKPGKPAAFESAMQQANLTSDMIIRNDRNVLLVLVEGMGAFADPQERSLLESKLRDAAGNRFKLTHGVNAHYGSTSGAISRELCGRWGTFTDYLADKRYDCLPFRLADAGFATISYDGFKGGLLALRDWYPSIGLKTLNFRDDLERDHPSEFTRQCGSALKGLCDSDVGKRVHRELAASNGQRKFVYWLTLNSHLPYVPVENGPLACNSAQARITDRIPCELTEIWMEVFDAVAAIAADPDLPPLDIMVVGDHNTPMWSRAAASHFRTGLIDWYRLEYVANR
jgi:hypothetical protein